MSNPALLELDKLRSRLAAREVSVEEVNSALRPRWVTHQQARGVVSNWGPPSGEAALGRLVGAVLQGPRAACLNGSAGLLALQRAFEPSERAEFRRGPGRPLASNHRPASPQAIDRALERFFEWLAAPSFAQLHPIVQMSLAQARIMEIQPFAEPCEPLASAFAAGFPLAAGYLLPVADPETADQFPPALQEAFELSTAPLVRLNLEAALRSYTVADRLLGL